MSDVIMIMVMLGSHIVTMDCWSYVYYYCWVNYNVLLVDIYIYIYIHFNIKNNFFREICELFIFLRRGETHVEHYGVREREL